MGDMNCNMASMSDTNSCFLSRDPNDMWRKWKNTFLNVVDTHAPYFANKEGPLKKIPMDYFRIEKTYA